MSQLGEVLGRLAQYRLECHSSQVSLFFKARIQANVQNVFDYLASGRALPELFTGYGRYLPALVNTSRPSGPWQQLDSSRILHFADGRTAHEHLTGYHPPQYLGYDLTNLPAPLSHIATDAASQWWFSADGADTQLHWTFTFHAPDRHRARLLNLFARHLWSAQMHSALQNLRAHFDSDASHRISHPTETLLAS